MPCSAISRSKIRFTVCCCLRGASKSARSIASIAGLNGSSRDLRGGSFFRGAGQAELNASRTVRRCTRYLRASARTDSPSLRLSLRIAANSSTFDRGATRASQQPTTAAGAPTPEARRSSHPHGPGGAKTHPNKIPRSARGASAHPKTEPELTRIARPDRISELPSAAARST